MPLATNTYKGGGKVKMIKDFMWGTFNYRNKGIPFYQWPRVGFYFMKERQKNIS